MSQDLDAPSGEDGDKDLSPNGEGDEEDSAVKDSSGKVPDEKAAEEEKEDTPQVRTVYQLRWLLCDE